MRSFPVLILGDTGAGKSSSIKSLPYENTFLFNVCKTKILPFKGAFKNYTEYNPNTNPHGNMITTDDSGLIKATYRKLIVKNNNIKYVVVDDSQYLIVNEFLREHSKEMKKGEVYTLYNKIADHFWSLILDTADVVDNLFIFYLHHTEYSEQGKIIPKTVGRLLNEKINIAGMFTFVFLAIRDGEKNYFYTQNDGTNPAKTPEGMFEDITIPNDLLLVSNKILQYYIGESK